MINGSRLVVAIVHSVATDSMGANTWIKQKEEDKD